MTAKLGLPKALIQDVRSLIETARQDAARSVNSALVTLYWNVGQRIRQDVLKERRAEYGERIVSALARQLTAEFGRGYSEKSLRHMIRFAESFSDFSIVSSLMRQLAWTHFLSLIYMDDPLKRDFYAEMCRIENFYNRKLRRLVAIDLKLDRFKAEHKGQMELYLRWLEKHEMQPGEETPVGLILCAGKSDEQVELLRLSESGIRVAAYLTELPPRAVLEKRLHEAVRRARARRLPAAATGGD